MSDTSETKNHFFSSLFLIFIFNSRLDIGGGNYGIRICKESVAC